nr:MAG TPA: Nucleotidyltransferase [Caudoviricetes sp.]
MQDGAPGEPQKIPEYYGFFKYCRLLRSIDCRGWRPER